MFDNQEIEKWTYQATKRHKPKTKNWKPNLRMKFVAWSCSKFLEEVTYDQSKLHNKNKLVKEKRCHYKNSARLWQGLCEN
jgi:hypothetical protein